MQFRNRAERGRFRPLERPLAVVAPSADLFAELRAVPADARSQPLSLSPATAVLPAARQTYWLRYPAAGEEEAT